MLTDISDENIASIFRFHKQNNEEINLEAGGRLLAKLG
jgi:hypothetical protein